MPEDLRIRLVPVEFVRGGPPHNQLLSPLTQYLAICGEAGAGIVTVPYEHAEFARRLKELRYETGDAADRQAMLHSTGVEMGRILGAVPGLPGALTNDPGAAGTLIHLRLTLSASELALLPFEVAKLPVSSSATAESWLSVQTRPLVCVTRNVRTVSPEGVVWPNRPRILFVAGDPDNVPYAEHRRVLLDAIQPFQYPGRDDLVTSPGGAREQAGELLTILVNPTLADVLRECRQQQYTHVHILTHGDLSETSPDQFGLVLNGPDGAPDVVSGEQFATALTSLSGNQVHRPTVVTVASCDSANVGTVIIPGASFAHALHQSGIPLVVASQFPLSKEGSIPLAESLYRGLLWGEHPLVLLQQLRAELHARYTSTWHDWASFVVYEALPQALPDQLDALRYAQTRRAINAALERVDRAVQQAREHPGQEQLPEVDAAIERAVSQLPFRGQYGVECMGLRASAQKRLAEAAFTLAATAGGDGAQAWRDPYDLLDRARHDYQGAVRGLLVSDAHGVQRIASLHWVLVQVVSLSIVLGREADDRQWAAATLSADLYRDHPSEEERAWAHGSLAELSLLRLAEPGLPMELRRQFSDAAVQHAQELARLYPWGDEFPVKSTRRQFRRYVEWWGTARFDEDLRARGVSRRAPWDGDFGVLETANRVIAVLDRKGPSSRRPTRGSPPLATPSGEQDAQAPATSAPAPRPVAVPSTAGPEPRPRPRRGSTPFLDVTMMPAGHGDSLWIEYGEGAETRRWLVDCGTQQTSRELLHRVDALPERQRRLELFVMSHIDSDHIGGALPFFKAVRRGLKFGDVWFNGWRHLSGRLGARQGEMFSTVLEEMELPWNEWREGGAIVLDGGESPVHTLPGGMKLTLLSPGVPQLKKLAPVWTREMKKYGLTPGSRVDYSRFLRGTPSTSTNVDALADAPFDPDAGVPNGTSIALLAEFGGASVLLAADAHAPLLVESIRALLKARGAERLKLDAFKVSHHASQNNLSTELLQLLDCRLYLVSTNGDHFCHPDREAIARIIKYGNYGGRRPALVFNYRSRYNEVWARPDLQEQHGYSAYYPEGDAAGATISVLKDEIRAYDRQPQE